MAIPLIVVSIINLVLVNSAIFLNEKRKLVCCIKRISSFSNIHHLPVIILQVALKIDQLKFCFVSAKLLRTSRTEIPCTFNFSHSPHQLSTFRSLLCHIQFILNGSIVTHFKVIRRQDPTSHGNNLQIT